MSTAETRPWLERSGYVAKGVVYVLVAVAAALHAFNPNAPDTFAGLLREPITLALAGLIALGLATYALWRLVDAVRNPEGRGPAHRARFALSGLANGALAAVMLNLLLTAMAGGEPPAWTAWLGQDGIVGTVGVGLALLGILQFYQVFSARFMRRLPTEGMDDRERWVTKRTGQWGYAARGLVYAVLGALLLVAGWSASDLLYAPWLMALLAAGMAAYGMSQWVQAGYGATAAVALLLGVGGILGAHLPASKVAPSAAGKRRVQLASAAPSLPSTQSRLASNFVPPPRESLPIPFVPPVLEPFPDQPNVDTWEPAPYPDSSTSSVDVREIIRAEAEKHGVDPLFVECIVRQESNFDPNATSYVGAMGLMQLMPETAADLGVQNPYDPAENVAGGVRYIAGLLAAYGGDHVMALAAYNAGPGNVEHYGGIPPFEETQNYVAKIMADYQSRLGSA